MGREWEGMELARDELRMELNEQEGTTTSASNYTKQGKVKGRRSTLLEMEQFLEQAGPMSENFKQEKVDIVYLTMGVLEEGSVDFTKTFLVVDQLTLMEETERMQEEKQLVEMLMTGIST